MGAGSVFGAWRKAVRSQREGREKVVKAVEEACKALEAVENELKSNNKFFGGDNIGLVDIVGIFIGYWVPIMQTALGFEILSSHRFPKLSKWSEDLTSHSVVKEILLQNLTFLLILKLVFYPKIWVLSCDWIWLSKICQGGFYTQTSFLSKNYTISASEIK